MYVTNAKLNEYSAVMFDIIKKPVLVDIYLGERQVKSQNWCLQVDLMRLVYGDLFSALTKSGDR